MPLDFCFPLPPQLLSYFFFLYFQSSKFMCLCFSYFVIFSSSCCSNSLMAFSFKVPNNKNCSSQCQKLKIRRIKQERMFQVEAVGKPVISGLTMSYVEGLLKKKSNFSMK